MSEQFDPAREYAWCEGTGDPERDIWLRPDPELATALDVLHYGITFDGYDYAQMVFGQHLLAKLDEIRERCQPRHYARAGFVDLRLQLFFIQRALRHTERDWDGVMSPKEIVQLLDLNQALCLAWERERGDAERLKSCGEAEIEAALADLNVSPRVVRALDWPGGLERFEWPGLYAWWVDESGAAELSAGLGFDVPAGRVYVGQTGGTKWPSGAMRLSSLHSRISKAHLGRRMRASTWRRTLAAILRERLDLRVQEPRKLSPECEQRLTRWMADHLSIAIHPTIKRFSLLDLEAKVLRDLDPPLNLDEVPLTPARDRLRKLRSVIESASAGGVA